VQKQKVVKMEAGCGRMQNRLLTFDDGTQACARYRINTSLMQGEIYSYFLAKLLGISNLPDLTVDLPDIHNPRWQLVGEEIMEAGWLPTQLVILSRYIDGISDTYVPSALRELVKGSITPAMIASDKSLKQWSDLIVYDYIIGNMDRLVNSLHNKQWNAQIMAAPVHNLGESNNALVIFDNEDGLLHGYRILDRYSHFHEQSLKAICGFNKKTVKNLYKLASSDIEKELSSLISETEPQVLQYLPQLPSKTIHTLEDRVSSVISHVNFCETESS